VCASLAYPDVGDHSILKIRLPKVKILLGRASRTEMMRQGDQVVVMEVDSSGGRSSALEHTRSPLPNNEGYYGQIDWDYLFNRNPPPEERDNGPQS
jgi:hypothetical protein